MEFLPDDNGVIVENMRVEALAPTLFRVRSTAKETLGPVVTRLPRKKPDALTRPLFDGFLVSTGAVTVSVDGKGNLDFFLAGNKRMCRTWRESRTITLPAPQEELEQVPGYEVYGKDNRREQKPVQVVYELEGDERFYGLGDPMTPLNKRDYDYRLWNTDYCFDHEEQVKSLYKSVPFFIVAKEKGCFGVLLDNSYCSYFDFGHENQNYYWFGADGGELDCYYFFGDTPAQVVAQYMELTGRPKLPQLWTLGYHQSRWGYSSQEQVMQVAQKLRSLGIPCDSIHLDIDYMDGFRVFTWNPQTFPEPLKMLAELRQEGFKPVCIVDPGVKVDESYPVYREGVERNAFLRTPEGKIYTNTAWPGKVAFPDFSDPQVDQWWGEKIGQMTEQGVRGIWNDMNEPAVFENGGQLPGDIQLQGRTHAEMHNRYGTEMARATADALQAADGRRPFVITRAAFAGAQNYAITWTGDNKSLWSNLRCSTAQICSMGLSGLPITGMDVGGFGGNCTPELFARWMELGCWMPLFRSHCSKVNDHQEPWCFGSEVLKITKKFINLRYHLLPYYYDVVEECSRTGAPIVRPLVWEYPEDRETWQLNDEFMVGSSILVAPVVDQGCTRRMVYLPAGDWYTYGEREYYKGGCWVMVSAPLAVCPIFVQGSAMLPACPVKVSNTDEIPKDELLVELYPGAGMETHYQDDGESFDYRVGAYNRYRFSWDGEQEPIVELLHTGRPGMVYRQIVFVDGAHEWRVEKDAFMEAETEEP